MRLAIDLDGCLADFNLAYGRLFIKTTGRNLFPEDWEQQLSAEQFPKTWSWEKDAGYTDEEFNKIWKIITMDDQFWSTLDSLPGTQQVIRKLNSMSKAGDDVYFITNRMGYKAKLQTETWLYGLGMDYPTVIIAANKVPIIKALDINFFVDDRKETILEVAAATSLRTPLTQFHLFCRDAPYNRVPYPETVRTVGSVFEALETTIGGL